MKTLFSILLLAFAVNAHAADFKPSAQCQSNLKADLEERHMSLVRIAHAAFYEGGSDGASSWDDETVFNVTLQNNGSPTAPFLVWVDDSANCKVLKVEQVR